MLISRTLGLAVIATTLGGAAVANAQQISQNFTLPATTSNAIATTSSTLPLGTGFAWTIDLTTATANGSVFGSPVPLSIGAYGTNPSDLSAGGVYIGNSAGTMWSHRYSFKDVGGITPAYDFTVSLLLNSNLTISTQITINSLGSFTAGGVTGSPIPVPVASIDIGGTAQATALIPAPGPAALIAAGGLLAFRRKRA